MPFIPGWMWKREQPYAFFVRFSQEQGLPATSAALDAADTEWHRGQLRRDPLALIFVGARLVQQ